MSVEQEVGDAVSRRSFIKLTGYSVAALILPLSFTPFSNNRTMEQTNQYDVLIIGGSYAGLSAGMALGRSLKKVLIIDGGKPCNRQTPHSHNFLTQDGNTPSEIAALGKQQVEKYPTVSFFNGIATLGTQTATGFAIQTATGETFHATKLIFATGIEDQLPAIEGLAACWGISVLHCPYCHGYEVRAKKTGIIGNGEMGFEFTRLISNWTQDLTLYTNGINTLTAEQLTQLQQHSISVVETPIAQLAHSNGMIHTIHFKDGTTSSIEAMYAHGTFTQHCDIPEKLGCELTEDGYLKIDALQQTTLLGVYACGDATTRMRTVANAVAMGALAGMMVNKELVTERF